MTDSSNCIKIGDSVQLYHGDCLEVMLTLGAVDLILADIPYGVVNRTSNGLRNLDKGIADTETFDLPQAMSLVLLLSDVFHIWCGTEQVSDLRRIAVESNCSTRLFVWEKTNPSPMNGEYIWLSGIECSVYGKKRGIKRPFNQRCQNSIWRGPTVKKSFHPTPKPVALMEYLIKTYTNEGETVLDFTMGSGTTGVACLRTGRKFIGIEKDEKYFNIAKERIEKELSDNTLLV